MPLQEPDVATPPAKSGSLLYRLEDGVVALLLCATVLMPLIEIAARRTVGEGVPDSIAWVRHLTLWVGFLGAAVAARRERHLALGFMAFFRGKLRSTAGVLATSVSVAVCLFLAWSSVQMVQVDRESADLLGGFLPLWIAELVMPLSFALVGVRLLYRAPGGPWSKAATVFLTAGLSLGLSLLPPGLREACLFPGLALIVAAAAAGAPIFAVLGGAGLFLFYLADTPIASVPVEAYRIASNAILPSLPLFTLAGTILAESQASARLVRVFRAWFGWLPGGTAIAAVTVCGFFTTFTGGSGVTILALGGLMLPVLLRQGYQERFSLGTLTAAGSLGILFPPSLLIILYGVQAQTAIDRLFAAGIAPGTLLVVLVSGYALARGWSARGARSSFSLREAGGALWEAKWEIALPVVVLVSIFSGYATLVEAAALTAFYTLTVEVFIHRELSLRRDFAKILVDCAVMVGGIFIILACAMGFTNYLVDADVPTRGADWVQSGIESQWLFLLALNAFLLVVGCLMDIFSAIVVVVPLILPVADAFGVDRVHLGIIFLANMELGYLTPPVGMNLFVAAFRFNRPLMEIYRASVPFLIIMLAGVLLITYAPWLTVGVLDWLGI